jgi:hypothetical protein
MHRTTQKNKKSKVKNHRSLYILVNIITLLKKTPLTRMFIGFRLLESVFNITYPFPNI